MQRVPFLPIVFMFSGQGSQYYHMGKALFEADPTFKATLLELDRLAKPVLGKSVVETIYDQEKTVADIFNQTLDTHPAIFIIELAMAQTLVKRGVRADYIMGTSLGAFAAAVMAGCFSFAQALSAVFKQASLLEQHCMPGRMVAVFENPSIYDNDINISANSTFAGSNFDSHFVLAGDKSEIQGVEDYLTSRNITHHTLPVSHGFHSDAVDPIAANYKHFLSTQNISHPITPWVCCMQGNVTMQLSQYYFWEVIRQPIYFKKSIDFLEKMGNYHYIDLGPSGTLATFIKYNLGENSQSKFSAVMTPYGRDVENLQQLLP